MDVWSPRRNGVPQRGYSAPFADLSLTYAALGGIALMAVALALAGVLPMLGWIVAALAVLGAAIGALVMHDWPPFMSYVILLVMALGLIRAS